MNAVALGGPITVSVQEVDGTFLGISIIGEPLMIPPGDIDFQSRTFHVDQGVTTCATETDCYDGNYCTVDTCEEAPDGTCVHTPIDSRPYADVYGVPDGDGTVEIMDTLCIVDASRGTGECLTDVGGYMLGDIYPCRPPEGAGPDGAVEIMDTLAVLDAAAGEPRCSPWCP